MRWLRQLFVPTFVVSSSRLSSVVSMELSRDHGTGDINEDRCAGVKRSINVCILTDTAVTRKSRRRLAS